VRADDYIRRGSRKIHGWMTADAALLVKVISEAQVDAGTKGSVGEIGVHHGRLFILLCLLAQPNERAFAIDIFEAQELNVDRSGCGDRTILEGHLRRVGADLREVDIICRSSLDVSPQFLTEKAGPVRLFSIDGGHTTSITLNDLRLAEATLADGGVVILDDVFTSTFPGVSAALAAYLTGSGRLVPFAVSPQKVLLAQPAHHDHLMAAVADGMPDLVLRTEDYFGSGVLILRSQPTVREAFQLGVARTTAYRRLRHTPMVGLVIEHLRPAVLRAVGR
jgi:hypothetical protein